MKNNNNLLDVNAVIERQYQNILNYNKTTKGREKSWDWCHKAFLEHKELIKQEKEPKKITDHTDYLSLHLFAFLGSFGMLRGSSELLKCDYKVFIGLIQDVILDEYYESLFDDTCPYEEREKKTQLIFVGNEKHKNGVYGEISKYLHDKGISDTDTLTTKILLGTYGCLPAYDRFLKAGIKLYNSYCGENKNLQLSQTVTHKEKGKYTSYEKFAVFYKDKGIKVLKNSDITYTPMKLVDMYFNELGYEQDLVANVVNNNKNAKNSEEELKKLGILQGNNKNELKVIYKIK